MKRSQWSAIFFALLLFGSGAAVGILGQRYYNATTVNAKTSEVFRHRYVAEMQTRLRLTQPQISELETILDETKAKYKAVRDTYRPEMLRIKGEQVERVKSILTPQQVPEYEKLVAEREQRAREQEERDRQAEAQQKKNK